MVVKSFELWMAGAVVMLLALVMMMLITELLGKLPMGGGGRGEERQGKVKGGKVSSGMERSLSVLAALSGPGRRAQPVGKAVGMLGWIEAMAQVLRKVGERARARGWTLRVA